MNTMERIKHYLDYKKVPIAVFERSVGMSNNSFGKTYKSGGSIGLDKLENILSVYQDLSAEWLLRGTGSMIIGEGVNQEQLLKSIDLPENSREIIEVWMKFMQVTEGMQEIYKQTIKKKEE